MERGGYEESNRKGVTPEQLGDLAKRMVETQDSIEAEIEHDGLVSLKGLKMRADELKVDVFGEVGIATFILR